MKRTSLKSNLTRIKYRKDANNFVSSNEKVYSNSFVDPMSATKYYYKTIAAYNAKTKENMKWYHNLKEESREFLKSYMLIQKKKEKLKAEIKDSKLTSPFLDLINQYTQRGYKIPDLSVKKNLFSPSIILADGDRLKEYFKINKLSRKEKKELSYVNKVNTFVNKNQQKLDKIRGKNKEKEEIDDMSTIEVEDTNQRKNSEKLSIKMHNIKIENEEMEKYNKELEECIDSYSSDTFGNFCNYLKGEIGNNIFPNSTKNRKSAIQFNSTFMNNFVPRNNSEPTNEEDPTCRSLSKNTLRSRKSGAIAYSLFKKDNTFINNKKTTRKTSLIKLDLTKDNMIHNKTLTNSTHENDSSSLYYNQTLPSIRKEDQSPSGDPADFFKVIRNMKRKVLSYNFDNVRKMILNKSRARDSTQGRDTINKIIMLDNKIENLDKDLIKTLEVNKS